MLIECNHCSAIVDAKELGQKAYGPDDYGDPRKYILLECPQCDSVLLGFSELEPNEEDQWEFKSASRCWPEADNNSLHHAIPKEVTKALKDAQKCFKAGVYSATAVMCGRAIESICKEKTGAKTIAKGLEKMKAQGDIDEKIWNWADALRKERNLGAHATGYDTTEEDAEDILSFAVAICDYVYVLNEQYEEYMLRKGST
jgi:HEPN domain-containing protein